MATARTCTNAKVYTKVPDGGWGWVVAVAFFFVEVFTYGVIKTCGVFFGELITYFEESNSLITALKDHLGWRHSLLLLGVLQLNIVVCGSLLRPMKIQKEVQVEETPKKESVGTEYILENEKTLTSIDSIDSGVEVEFWGLTVCSTFYGCMLGSVAGTHISMLADDDVVGIEKMSSAVGVYVFIQSIAGLAGPPLGVLLKLWLPSIQRIAGFAGPRLGGVLVDQTQNYASVFYSCAIGMALASMCLALVRPCKNGLCRRKPKKSIEEGDYNENYVFKDVPDDFLEMDFVKPEGTIKSNENTC
ncbi:hypothetical protein NDU88_007817 [Pleurodeles waltl]|uniref:Monocarboxylate transporter 7 n=1 Tax=Pleurodeles waltl TaxID=8319 RepID=A0AAV7PUJ9_PLEWA|nr:hypothetical protein NDU88_007817 [Pleurodeles waltl]